MCPACIAAIAITVAKTTGAGAAVTALVVGVRKNTEEKKHESNRRP